jgi:adenine deaminase
MKFSLKGNVVDIFARKIYAAEVFVNDGIIENIIAIDEHVNNFILPGFIDAHIHIESSMLVPSEFAKIAVQHGTVATVSDPHEIANVCGMQGVQYMLDNAAQVPFKFNFGAPSCVPATSFETAGAILDAKDVATLLANPQIKYLSEMMNYPGVLFKDPEVMAKIQAAKDAQKPIDGHVPGLTGRDATTYINAGISTDHECYTLAEAEFKLQHGMKVLIREGSAARNFEALHPLIAEYYEDLMFCCDDKHPDELLLHHINKHVKDAVALGYDVFSVLQMACINPVQHYKLDVGLLRIGDAADFIEVNDLVNFNVHKTFINGACVFDGDVHMPDVQVSSINNFNVNKKSVEEFAVAFNGEKTIPVIDAIYGQLITNRIDVIPNVSNHKIICDTKKDILKISVVNRYHNAPIANTFIRGFALQQGAIASTIAHDCHNIVIVGTNDEDMCAACNALIAAEGGICVANGNEIDTLALPVAGLMSMLDAQQTAAAYTAISNKATTLGSTMPAAFMALSFMALLVIPKLKLSDKGLFDGERFEFV